MENKFLRKLTFLATLVALIVPSFGNVKPVFADNDSWSVATEGSEQVYTSVSGKNGAEFGGGTEYVVAESTTDNAFEVKIRCNANDENKNVGIHVISSKSNCFFDFRVDALCFRYRMNSPINWLLYDYVIDDYSIGEWLTMKIVCATGQINCYVNNNIAYSVQRNDIELDEYNKFTISCWNSDVSFKDARTFTEEMSDEPIIPGSWAHTVEGGEDVYTLTNGGPSDFACSGANNGRYNTFEFSLRVNSLTQEGDANISACIYVGDNFFFFEYNPSIRSYFRLRYVPKGSSEGEQLECADIDLPSMDTWVNVKVVFATSYLAGYVNGQMVVFSDDTKGEDLTKGVAHISAWCALASVKNFKTSTTKIDYSTTGYLDLEFNDNRAIESFTSSNCDMVYEKGNMKISLNGEKATIASPDIKASKGKAYSMKLPVRNTFAVRLKNESDANKIKLYFKTRVDTEYMSKEFDIIPNSGYQMYYFNVSDVFDCGEWHDAESLKKCKHYLNDFKFEFEGATSGDIYLDAITFEREDKLLPYRATEVHATADEDTQTVTFSGTLKGEFANSNVTILSTEISNYADLIDWKGNKVLATTVANGTEFSVSIPLKQEGRNMTHFSTVFLAVASSTSNYKQGYLCSKQFMIENYEEFEYNPYHFDLPDYTVDVTDEQFGAVGDAYTCDTKAIQAAIDHVSEHGGGTVRIPGDTSNPYERRYIVTYLTMKDNVNLQIEKGAVLWQSQRDGDYDYNFVKSHDVTIEGCPWTHSAVSWNKPFIYFNETSHSKITGGGTIRMADTGTECLDGNRYGGNNDITLNCGQFIHEHPIVSWKSDYIEVSHITIRRNAIWTFPNHQTKHLYVCDVKAIETSCINGDGFNLCSGEYAKFERNTLYSNDDAMIISVSYYDPRNDKALVPFGWDGNIEYSDTASYSIAHVEVTRNNVFGGHGLTFIPWGSACPNEEVAETYDIVVRDNVLGGTSTSVGVWGDSPFHGSSNMSTYDQLEGDDYSPMRDIIIVDNIYTDPVVLATWQGGTTYNATGFINDGGIYSSNYFMNASFDKVVRFETDKDFVSGLAYWTREGDTGTEKVKEGLGYSAYIKGNGNLSEGLFEIFGGYEVSIKTKLVSGSAKLRAVDYMDTSIVYGEVDIAQSNDFVESTLSFGLDKSTTVKIGVWHEGDANSIIYIDDAKISVDPNTDVYDIDGKTVNLNKKDYWTVYNSGTTVPKFIDGSVITGNGGEYKIMCESVDASEFAFSTDISISKTKEVNAGVYLYGANIGKGQDKIDALNIQIESKPGENTFTIALYNFTNAGGFLGCLAKSNPIEINNDYVNVKVVSKSGYILVFIDNSKDYAFQYYVGEDVTGYVGLRGQQTAAEFKNIVLTYRQIANLTSLNSLLNEIADINLSLYTEESVKVLTDEVAIARTLTKYSSQSEIDREIIKLTTAKGQLVLKQGEDTSEIPETSETPTTSEDPIVSENPSIEPSVAPSVAPTSEEAKTGGCGGNIMAFGAIFAIISLIGICLLTNKRKLINKEVSL